MKLTLNFSDDSEEISGSISHGSGDSPIPINPIMFKQFKETMEASTKTEIGLLPPAVRWISPDKSFVVFERPPMKQLMEYIPLERSSIPETSKLDSLKKVFEIEVPWTVYLVHFDKTYLPVNIRVFARNSYLTSLDDPVYLLPLLNFYTNGELCNPRYGRFEGMPSSLGEGINIAYNTVWNSGWNFDLKDAIDYCTRYPNFDIKIRRASLNWDVVIYNFFEKWSKFGREEILNFNWMPLSTGKNLNLGPECTLADVISTTQCLVQQQNFSKGRNFIIHTAGSLV